MTDTSQVTIAAMVVIPHGATAQPVRSWETATKGAVGFLDAAGQLPPPTGNPGHREAQAPTRPSFVPVDTFTFAFKARLKLEPRCGHQGQ